jgi:hypothetical protein
MNVTLTFYYQEHIRQSCEDRLDSLVGSRLTLDPKKLQRDSEHRGVSLERENHTNEMFKRQRSFSKHKVRKTWLTQKYSLL